MVNVLVTLGLLPALFTAPLDPDAPRTVRAGTLDTVAVSHTTGAAVAVVGPDALTIDQAIDRLAPVPTLPTTTTVAPVFRPKPKPRPKLVYRPAPKAKPKPKPVAVHKAAAPAPRPAAKAAPTPFEAHGESGRATWYHQSSGVCAHKSLPMGTVVTVTNTRNGKTTQCRVGDRGPFVAGYVIDLAPQQFDEVSSRSAGVFPTKISW